MRSWPLFFLLYGCVHSESSWELESIGEAPYSRLSLSCSAFPKTTLEFVPIRGEIASFITFSESQIVPSSEKKASISFRINHQTYERTAELHEGNQRLALGKETTNLLIGALLEGKSVEIEINSYKTPISPDHFSKSYEKLLSKKKSWELSSLFHAL